MQTRKKFVMSTAYVRIGYHDKSGNGYSVSKRTMSKPISELNKIRMIMRFYLRNLTRNVLLLTGAKSIKSKSKTINLQHRAPTVNTSLAALRLAPSMSSTPLLAS